MKTSTRRVKKHKKSHLTAVNRPRKTKGKSKLGARAGHVLHKKPRKSKNHFPTGIVTTIASTIVGLGLAGVIVARGGVDVIKKTWNNLF
jgi:hypothetical protein